MMANVRIASWTAEGGTGQDGFYIKRDGIVGLTGGVGVRRNVVPRAQGHGDFRVPSFRESRYVEISGPCIADSSERLDWYNRQLTGLMSTGSAKVTFDTPGGLLWAVGELATEPEFDITVWGERADWMLPIYFANPRLFGDTEVDTQAQNMPVTSINRGNFPATSILTVAGSAPGYTIYGPGGLSRTITLAVAPGTPHVIDMANGQLTINGVHQSGVSFGATWSTPGGGSVVQTVVPTSGVVTLSAATKATTI